MGYLSIKYVSLFLTLVSMNIACSSEKIVPRDQPNYSTSNSVESEVLLCKGPEAEENRALQTPKYETGTLSYKLSDLTIKEIAVSVKASVYYPAVKAGEKTQIAAGNFPLVIGLHGNHDNVIINGRSECSADLKASLEEPESEEIQSELGFDYIGKYLSGAGYIFVSINANDLNCQPQTLIAGRAELVLHHLSKLKSGSGLTPLMNELRKQTDFSHVVLLGHSRGAEAVAAIKQAPQGISLSGIVSVAPTDLEKTVPQNTSLLVVVPAADGDVWQNDGAKLYDRAKSSGSNWFKSQIYIYGANHNFYNTSWTQTTTVGGILKPQGDDGVDNGQERLPAQVQREHFLAHLSSFLSATINKDLKQREVFLGFKKISGFAAVRSIHSYFDKGPVQKLKLADFAGNGDSLKGYSFKHDQLAYNDTFFHDTDGFVGKWENPSSELEVKVPLNLSKARGMSLRLAQVYETIEIQPNSDQTLSFEISDQLGEVSKVALGNAAGLLAPYMRPSYVTQDSEGNRVAFTATKSMLGSMAIDRRCIQNGNPKINLANIVGFKLLFNEVKAGLTLAIGELQLFQDIVAPGLAAE